jgi:hypothetical protein
MVWVHRYDMALTEFTVFLQSEVPHFKFVTIR